MATLDPCPKISYMKNAVTIRCSNYEQTQTTLNIVYQLIA